MLPGHSANTHINHNKGTVGVISSEKWYMSHLHFHSILSEMKCHRKLYQEDSLKRIIAVQIFEKKPYQTQDTLISKYFQQ